MYPYCKYLTKTFFNLSIFCLVYFLIVPSFTVYVLWNTEKREVSIVWGIHYCWWRRIELHWKFRFRLIHAVKWNKDTFNTYHVVWKQNVNEKLFDAGKNACNSLSFYCYDDPESAEKNEKLRKNRHITIQFQISASTIADSNQKRFLG